MADLKIMVSWLVEYPHLGGSGPPKRPPALQKPRRSERPDPEIQFVSQCRDDLYARPPAPPGTPTGANSPAPMPSNFLEED